MNNMAENTAKNQFLDQLHENQNLYFLEQKNELRAGPSAAVEKWALQIKIEEARDRLKGID